MKIYSFSNPCHHTPEKLSKKRLVETGGYVPLKRQILSMIQAGERLKSIRAEQFDIPPGSDQLDAPLDPTRSPNFDVTDAQELARGVYGRKINKAPKKDENAAPVPSPAPQQDTPPNI